MKSRFFYSKIGAACLATGTLLPLVGMKETAADGLFLMGVSTAFLAGGVLSIFVGLWQDLDRQNQRG